MKKQRPAQCSTACVVGRGFASSSPEMTKKQKTQKHSVQPVCARGPPAHMRQQLCGTRVPPCTGVGKCMPAQGCMLHRPPHSREDEQRLACRASSMLIGLHAVFSIVMNGARVPWVHQCMPVPVPVPAPATCSGCRFCRMAQLDGHRPHAAWHRHWDQAQWGSQASAYTWL